MVRKLIIAAIILVLSATAMCGCGSNSYEQSSANEVTVQHPETEHLYWKDVECRIVKYDYNIAAPAICWCWIEIVNDEYGLTKTVHMRGYKGHELRNYIRSGKDTIMVEMCTNMIDSTGEVRSRYLTSKCRFH